LELGLEEKVWSNIREDFNAYLVKVFEEILKEYIVSGIKSGKMELNADVVRRYEEEEVDIAAYSSRKKEESFLK
jgi:hypothetical protein